MNGNESEVYYAERRFFGALSDGQFEVLDELLADDFLLIDVFSGAEFTKSGLLATVSSGELKFEEINRLDWWVRFYASTAVAIGSTKMRGRFGDDAFAISSRYTHIYAKLEDQWRLVSAQGTPITSASSASEVRERVN
jgi:Domain of unknown function (DUF4440)